MGLPFEMQEAKTMASAPRSTSIFARGMARFPGHPPQVTNPTISTGPVSAKAPFPSAVILKSVVPGQISSVMRQRMMPTFMVIKESGQRPCLTIWIHRADLPQAMNSSDISTESEHYSY